MLAKERLLSALKKEYVDRPPCICPGGMMNAVVKDISKGLDARLPEAHRDAQMMADLAAALYERDCFENYGVPFCMTVEAESLGAEVEMGTDEYEPHVIKYAIDSVKDWKQIHQMDYNSERMEATLEAIRILKAKKDNVPIVGNITGPISTASSIMEPVVFYKDLRKNNKDAHRFMEIVTERLISFSDKQIEAGADVIAISDPSGTGEILGPKLFEEFAVKYINELVQSIKSKGKGTIVHICGQMKKVYKEVNQIESDALSFDSIVGIREAKENLADRVLMGNVSTYALEFGEPKKIVALSQKCIRDGVDILSPACGLGMKSPIGNIRAVLESVKKES